MVLLKIASLVLVLSVIDLVKGQNDANNCAVNQLFNGKICTCVPGYFASENEESAKRCEDECEEVYSTYFTYGKCVKEIFDKADQQPACNMRCGLGLYLWASIAIFVVIAAALATLFFTIPLCIASCCSCLQARKANKNTKRVYADSQGGAPGKDQLATMSYNPYAYWPYYGRT
uniref:Uncharacterized protein n=1 Tax=Acrobeloides nanus TaxID=290746 RepID=A0A914DG92_9BILA